MAVVSVVFTTVTLRGGDETGGAVSARTFRHGVQAILLVSFYINVAHLVSVQESWALQLSHASVHYLQQLCSFTGIFLCNQVGPFMHMQLT